MDILFHVTPGVFSYRVAGVLTHNGEVLLQRPLGDTGYAFPGGHVQFGETSDQTVIREYKEETGIDIVPQHLLWIGENYFPWGDQNCHQICLYYQVALKDGCVLPCAQTFMGCDQLEGKTSNLEFSWIDIQHLDQIEVYPPQAGQLLRLPSGAIEHFVYVEKRP
jgi:8-oxo-dGTP pyrophosphatase MutT (NUDIX family)